MATRWHGRSARKCQGEVGTAERRRGHRTPGEAEIPTPTSPRSIPIPHQARERSRGKIPNPRNPGGSSPGAAEGWDFLPGEPRDPRFPGILGLGGAAPPPPRPRGTPAVPAPPAQGWTGTLSGLTTAPGRAIGPSSSGHQP
ncbi:amyloid beta A4 precursor protein-binding family B member 1-interacting protein-like [Molothrus ater]|uniref:amyloid beta A4 precursor protein-binding family B member 1-interacting protein-like n=1 Tax=Molothrus ater TaxID=84834 RepID=UPI00174C12B3|nr:amyloid beta A4 precursor protein-binding family B member 1-interacting protein-like [Molothrus ater]